MAQDWTVGTLYIPGGLPGYFTQPAGQFGQVFPAQVQSSSELLSIKPYSELSGQFIFGCQHSANECMVFRDIKEDGEAVALLCCPLCSYISRYLPYEQALRNSLQDAILFP